LQREIEDSAIVTGGAQQNAHVIATRDQLAGDVTPEEARRASDQGSHALG